MFTSVSFGFWCFPSQVLGDVFPYVSLSTDVVVAASLMCPQDSNRVISHIICIENSMQYITQKALDGKQRKLI